MTDIRIKDTNLGLVAEIGLDDLEHVLHVYKDQMTSDIEAQDALIQGAARYPGATTEPMERLKAQFQGQRAWANVQLAKMGEEL